MRGDLKIARLVRRFPHSRASARIHSGVSMNLTLHEQERRAYQQGDTSTAVLLRQILDLCAEQSTMRAERDDMRTALVAARTLLTREGAAKRALDVIEAALK